MTRGELEKVYIFQNYPSNSRITADKGLVSVDNGSIGGTHRLCFYKNVTNQFTFIHLVGHQTKNYLTDYQKQSPFIFI